MANRPGFSRGAAADFLAERYGGSLREVAVLATIGTTPSQLIPADPERVQLTLINLSAVDVFIDFTGAPSATRGIRLGPNGGLVSFNVSQDGLLATLEWSAVAIAAGSACYAIGARRDTAFPR